MMLVHQDQLFSSISSTWKPYVDSFQFHPHTPIRVIVVFNDQIDIPSSILFPIQAPIEPLRTVAPSSDQQVGVRKKFVREVPQDLHCLTRISAICVVENVSIHLDI